MLVQMDQLSWIVMTMTMLCYSVQWEAVVFTNLHIFCNCNKSH
jgi:hypothetical protein